MTSSHCAVLILSGQRIARTSSSRISAAVPGQARQARRPSAAPGTSRNGRPQRLRAVPDLQRRERVHVDRRRRRLHGADRWRGRSRPCSRDGCRPAGRPRWRRGPRPRRVRRRSRRGRGRRASRASSKLWRPLEKAQNWQP